MLLLVDSSVWIDYFNGVFTAKTEYLDAYLQRQQVVLGDLILCEVLQGFAREREFEIARNALLRLSVQTMCGGAIALQAAQNYRLLRQRGITIRKTIDCLIATFAISRHMHLLHNDHDFDPFAEFLGLKVVLL